MNFLAHLHIAEHCQSSLLGNLLGDFVKGDPSLVYRADIVKGIRLHRFVDSYTDTHDIMREAKSYFDRSNRRFSGIALDVFWDHCLAVNWSQFHHSSLDDFCDSAKSRVKRESDFELPERYINVSTWMWNDGWLASYAQLSNIEFALQRMSKRSPRMGELENSFAFIERYYNELNALFLRLYPQVLNASKQHKL